MNNDERELFAREITDFRFGVIADLLNTHLGWGELNALVKQKAKLKHRIPYSDRTSVSTACIRQWLRLYKKFGKEGLTPKLRKDAGTTKSLPPEEIALIIDALEKRPHITASSIVKQLQQEGKVKSKVSKSSLSRLVISAGMKRSERLKTRDEEQNLKFNFFYPLECVQADDLHAFPVPDGKGKNRKAILMAFLDDATRRIVYADFSFSERSIAFEIGIKHILKTHGNISRLYVDNGSPFVSSQTKRICDILRIQISHSRPGIPKGRGKIERFFRTVRDQFLRPLDESSIKSLEDLNMRFRIWLETEYHRNPHRGLNNQTPLDAWLANAKYLTVPDPSIDLDRAFYHVQKRKVYKDSTFTVGGVLYEAPSILSGHPIKVIYDPVPARHTVFIEHDRKDYGQARPVDAYANARVIRNKTTNLFAVAGDLQVEPVEKAKAKDDELHDPVRLALGAATFKTLGGK
jgi:putative transposase